MNTCVDLLKYSSLIILRLMYIAINSILKMFCKSDSLIANSISLD